MNTWADDLPELDATTFAPFYDTGDAAARSVKITLDDRSHLRAVEGRDAQNMLHISNAARALDRLPPPGHSLHVIAGGAWPGFALIPAALRLSPPGSTLRAVRLGTLSFSKDNVNQLAELIDAGTIGRADCIYSVYFRSTANSEAAYMHEALERRGGRALALRFHAKLILLDFADGRAFTVEASANLRSCSNIEQFAIHHDRALHDFHATWFDELLDRAALEDPALLSATIAPRNEKRPQTEKHRRQTTRRKSRPPATE